MNSKPENSLSTRKPSHFLTEFSLPRKTFALLTDQQADSMLRNECSCVKHFCTSLLLDSHCSENRLHLSCGWMTQMLPGGDVFKL